MKYSIWKFPLALTSEQTINLPTWCKTLDLQLQNETPTLWALVGTEFPTRETKITMYATGEEIPVDKTDQEYLGTVQHEWFVFHFFKEKSPFV